MSLTVGSLFAGIGGFDLAAERCGMTVKWQVEIDPYATRVLEKHWPGVRRYGDIRQIDWASVEPVDLVCGGFPCQPHSLAGRRLASADDRDLWPEVVRCLRGVRPRWFVGENVSGLLSSDAGRFFGTVLGDLAASGFDAEWDCIPASAVGAPHQRDRVWIVAYPTQFLRNGAGNTRERRRLKPTDSGFPGCGCWDNDAFHRREGMYPDERCANYVANAMHHGREPSSVSERQERQAVSDAVGSSRSVAHVADASGPRSQERLVFTGVPGEARRDDDGQDVAVGGWWAVEPSVGRVAHGVPARVDRLRGLGNAIVPQVAEWIFSRILDAEKVSA